MSNLDAVDAIKNRRQYECQIISNLDTNKNGKIDGSEFVAADKDRNNRIEGKELGIDPKTEKYFYVRSGVLLLEPGRSVDLGGSVGLSLWDVDLSGADLSGADLSRADLGRTNLSGADLSRADFSEACLYDVDFHKTKLYKAVFSKAILAGAKGMSIWLHPILRYRASCFVLSIPRWDTPRPEEASQ